MPGTRKERRDGKKGRDEDGERWSFQRERNGGPARAVDRNMQVHART
jgi:hypothetical protein